MGAPPDLMFVIDTNKEAIAIAEARKLGMPIVAVVDSNCDPDGISHPIPGNDDAGRAITLYCDLIARAAIDGIERAQGSAGIDLGASDAPRGEPALDEGERAARALEKPSSTANAGPSGGGRPGRRNEAAMARAASPARRGRAAADQGRAPKRSLSSADDRAFGPGQSGLRAQ